MIIIWAGQACIDSKLKQEFLVILGWFFNYMASADNLLWDPVFTPQMIGLPAEPGAVMENVSVKQSPTELPVIKYGVLDISMSHNTYQLSL